MELTHAYICQSEQEKTDDRIWNLIIDTMAQKDRTCFMIKRRHFIGVLL
jgi:hypothetical protein